MISTFKRGRIRIFWFCVTPVPFLSFSRGWFLCSIGCVSRRRRNLAWLPLSARSIQLFFPRMWWPFSWRALSPRRCGSRTRRPSSRRGRSSPCSRLLSTTLTFYHLLVFYLGWDQPVRLAFYSRCSDVWSVCVGCVEVGDVCRVHVVALPREILLLWLVGERCGRRHVAVGVVFADVMEILALRGQGNAFWAFDPRSQVRIAHWIILLQSKIKTFPFTNPPPIWLRMVKFSIFVHFCVNNLYVIINTW